MGSDIRLAHGEHEYINIITLARGEIMLRMVKLRGAQLILHLCTARCNLHSEPLGESSCKAPALPFIYKPGRATRPIAGACSEPAQRANETSGHVGNRIGTPLKTAVTDSCVDDNTGASMLRVALTLHSSRLSVAPRLRLRAQIFFCSIPRAYAAGLPSTAHIRGLG